MNLKIPVIPEAEKEAIAKVNEIGKAGELRPGAGGSAYFHYYKTEYFHKPMNRLVLDLFKLIFKIRPG